MDFLECDVVILPEDDIAVEASALSERLLGNGTQFTLSPDGPFPHVSLCMLRFQKDRLSEVIHRLETIAAETKALDLTAIRYGQDEGYTDAEYRCTEALAAVQMQVLEAVSPLRAGLRVRDENRLPTLTAPLRTNLEKYGYRYVNEYFRPHLTFTRFIATDPIDLNDFPALHSFSGKYIELGLFELGENGTCVKEIARIPLCQ